MLHVAAQVGQAEVVQLLINDYNLDPTARTKVCGQMCRCLVKSSRASGGLCNARGRCACVRDVCELEGKLRFICSAIYIIQAACSCSSAQSPILFAC